MKTNEMKTNKKKSLVIVFWVLLALFLLFFGGALSVTIEDGGLMGSGWKSGISWMWMPSLLFLCLSILLGWGISVKKKLADQPEIKTKTTNTQWDNL